MMTGRERVLTALHHQQPDRTPMDFWARQDVTERLMSYLGLTDQEALLQYLGIDLRLIPLCEHHPTFAAADVLGGASESSGKRYIFHADGCFEDAWGVVRRQGKDGLYDEWVDGPFAGNRDLDSFAWPDHDIFDSVSVLHERVAAYRQEYALLGRLNLPFKVAWHMRGLETFLCDMLLDPGWAGELLRRAAAYEISKGVRFVQAGVDIVGIYGDIAMQDRMLVGPDTWRAIEKPIVADMIAALRSVNPAVQVFFHSDGDVSPVIPDLIEIGVDILNPIQPECMDPARVKAVYGDRLTLHGTISLQQTLPHGTAADVRREVEEREQHCGQNGGFILCPSNLIQNDVPLDNILALYDCRRSFA